jgi:hypothetical protein
MVWFIGIAAVVALVRIASSAGGAPQSQELEAGVCRARVVRALVSEFVEAFNRGDEVELDRLFEQPPKFRWYSSGAPGRRLRTAAHRRDTLIAYFRSRHRHGDTLRLESFRFVRGSGGIGHFGATFRRSADDFRGGRSFVIPGKGAALCPVQGARFFVMSLGGPRRVR